VCAPCLYPNGLTKKEKLTFVGREEEARGWRELKGKKEMVKRERKQSTTREKTENKNTKIIEESKTRKRNKHACTGQEKTVDP